MTSNVLCTKHNSALSELDVEGGRLFEALAQRADDRSATVHRFDGDVLQRWFLKVLTGVLAARLARSRLGQKLEPSGGRHWVELLLGQRSWDAGRGLFALAQVGQQLDNPNAISLAPLTRPGTVEPDGGLFVMRGITFALTISNPPGRGDLRGALAGAIYRPTAFNFRSATLRFGWDDRTLPTELRYLTED